MRVSALMTADPVTAAPGTSLDAAIRLMDEHGIRHLPVVDGGALVGMVSDRDVLAATGWLPARVHACRRASAPGVRPLCVEQIMQTEVSGLDADDDAAAAPRLFLEQRCSCLPVLRGGRLVGVLTEMDLLEAFAEGAFGASAPVAAPVAEHMTAAPITIHWFTPLGEALALCREHGIRHLPVLEAAFLVGIVSDRDLRRAVGVGRGEERPVDEVLTRQPIAIRADAPLSQAAHTMAQRRFNSLPVVDDQGELVGILTSTDVLAQCLAASSA